MKKITRRLIITLSAAMIVLVSSSIATARETSPSHDGSQSQSQARKGGDTSHGEAQGTGQQVDTARRLGNGDGTGNQGIRPEDGTGKGSPGRLGADNGKGKNPDQARKTKKRTSTATDKASKSDGGGSGSGGSGQGTLTRSRARDLSGSGTGSCTGSGARSRRGGGSKGSGGGRR